VEHGRNRSDRAETRRDGGRRGRPQHRQRTKQGAEAAAGEWLAFVDADTTVAPDYVERMLSFVEREGVTAATSRCRMTGPRRTKPVEWTIDHAFPRLSAPILPGFNTSVRRTAFESVGGFPDVPNEDTAFSRALGRSGPMDSVRRRSWRTRGGGSQPRDARERCTTTSYCRL
jgi:cellulose synthase/poly-beta-1,6-N-acetylglucosamine synthase-like glycosyltransferase